MAFWRFNIQQGRIRCFERNFLEINISIKYNIWQNYKHDSTIQICTAWLKKGVISKSTLRTFKDKILVAQGWRCFKSSHDIFLGQIDNVNNEWCKFAFLAGSWLADCGLWKSLDTLRLSPRPGGMSDTIFSGNSDYSGNQLYKYFWTKPPWFTSLLVAAPWVFLDFEL